MEKRLCLQFLTIVLLGCPGGSVRLSETRPREEGRSRSSSSLKRCNHVGARFGFDEWGRRIVLNAIDPRGPNLVADYLLADKDGEGFSLVGEKVREDHWKFDFPAGKRGDSLGNVEVYFEVDTSKKANERVMMVAQNPDWRMRFRLPIVGNRGICLVDISEKKRSACGLVYVFDLEKMPLIDGGPRM